MRLSHGSDSDSGGQLRSPPDSLHSSTCVHLPSRIWRTSFLTSTRMALQISRFGDRWTKTSSSRPSWTPSCWTTQRPRASSLPGPLSAVSPCSRTHSWPSPTSTCSLRGRVTAVRGKPRPWMNRWMRTSAGRAGWWPTTRTRCSGTLLTSGRGRGCWASTLPSRSCAVTYRRFPTRSGCRRSTRCGWPSRTSPCWERSSCRAATPNHMWTSAWRTATRTKPTRSGTQVVSWSLSSVAVEPEAADQIRSDQRCSAWQEHHHLDFSSILWTR